MDPRETWRGSITALADVPGAEMGLEHRNSKAETRNAPPGDPGAPLQPTYSLRVETNQGECELAG